MARLVSARPRGYLVGQSRPARRGRKGNTMITCTSQDQDYQLRFSDGEHEAFADTTPEHGGAGQGFRPHDLLEASLGSCLTIITRMYAKKHGIPLTSVTATVTLNRDNPGQAVFAYTLRFEGDLTDEQRAKLMRAAAACPVHKTLKRDMVFQGTMA